MLQCCATMSSDIHQVPFVTNWLRCRYIGRNLSLVLAPSIACQIWANEPKRILNLCVHSTPWRILRYWVWSVFPFKKSQGYHVHLWCLHDVFRYRVQILRPLKSINGLCNRQWWGQEPVRYNPPRVTSLVVSKYCDSRTWAALHCSNLTTVTDGN